MRRCLSTSPSGGAPLKWRTSTCVLLEGRLTLEQWTDQNGQKRSRHSITVENLKMLDRKGENEPQPQGGYGEPVPGTQPTQPAYTAPQKQQPSQELPSIDIDEDDIPF